MKITFTDNGELADLQREVLRGDTIESSVTVPEELLRDYVANGIATIIPEPPTEGGDAP